MNHFIIRRVILILIERNAIKDKKFHFSIKIHICYILITLH